MKTSRLLNLLMLPILAGLASLSFPGCSAKETAAPPQAKVAAEPPTPAQIPAAPVVAAAAMPPAPVVASAAEQPVQSVAPPAQVVQVAGVSAVTGAPGLPASETWDAIKDNTYDQRAGFVAGLEHITSRVDNAMQVLNARRATLPETSIQDWDFAMKDLAEARSDFRFQISELNKATPDTWSDAKDRAAQAWQRVRDDFDKVKLSTTI
jgi:hypothetical protein